MFPEQAFLGRFEAPRLASTLRRHNKHLDEKVR